MNQTITITLDAAGENIQQTNPQTQTVSRTYTARGLLASMKDSLNDEVHYTYDACGCPIITSA